MSELDISLHRIPNDLWEMELLGDHRYVVGIPIDADIKLKEKILGSIKTFELGSKSVDYVIKTYSEAWKFAAPEEDRLFFLNSLRAADRWTITIIDELLTGGDRPDHVGLFAAEMALIRLKATFRSAILLIMQGYPFESATMCRLILEQYAFAYSIKSIDDVDKILRIKTTRTISSLKKLLPYSGKLYGQLSDRSHLTPKDTRHYIGLEDGHTVIRYKMPEETKIILYYFLALVIDFELIVKEVLEGYIDFKELEKKSSDFSFNKEVLSKAFEKLDAQFHPQVRQ
jgi:hypothetical protein